MRATASRPGMAQREDRGSTSITLLGALLVLVASFAAYAPVLDNFFYEVDDPQFLLAGWSLVDDSGHFRPLQGVWNGFLQTLFGNEPFGYYLVGLLLHAVNALLVFSIARRLTSSAPAGVFAGLAFCVFYAPCEVVLWFGAQATLLVVFFILLCCRAFLVHLQTGSRKHYALALFAMVGAMASKEDCVVLAPCLVGLDLATNGLRPPLAGRLLRYVPFVVLAAVYLVLAFDPELWRSQEGVGQYELGWAMVAKIVRSIGVLFWPRAVHENAPPPWALAAGLAILAGMLAAATRLPRRRRLAALGAVVVVVGLAATAPGPFAVVIKRYTYVSAIGAGWLLGSVASELWDNGARLRLGRAIRGATLAGFLLWMGIQVLAIHSVESWRYAASGEKLRRLVASTSAEILAPLAAGRFGTEAFVISPPMFNEQGYSCGLAVFANLPIQRISVERVPCEAMPSRLGPDAPLDVASHAVFKCEHDGSVVQLQQGERMPIASWNAEADRRQGRGMGRTVAVFRIRAPERR